MLCSYVKYPNPTSAFGSFRIKVILADKQKLGARSTLTESLKGWRWTDRTSAKQFHWKVCDQAPQYLRQPV